MKIENKSSRREFIRNALLGIGLFSVDKNINSVYFNKNNINKKGDNKKMAYEWIFNKRPYTDDEAKELLKAVIDAETTDWHYNTHHKGYVTFLNNIEKELETADRSKANGNYSQIGELKRRQTWNHGGALLHDVYWEVLGGDGDTSKGPEVQPSIG